MSMGLDSLFERLVVATERIANAMEGATVKLAVDISEAPAQPAKRGRPKKDVQPEALKGDGVTDDTKALQAAVDAVADVAPAVVTKSFLDDEDEAAAQVEPVLTKEERYAGIRKGLQQLQTLTNPENALKVLKDVGKVEILRDLKIEQYGPMEKALAAAITAAKARTAA